MNRIPTRSDLTAVELSYLREIAHGFRSRAMCGGRIDRLLQLGLVNEILGGLMITPAGIMLARQ
jgi:hypothetical protein